MSRNSSNERPDVELINAAPAAPSTLTPRQMVHQRRCLRARLAEPRWIVERAAWLLAGIDPDRTMTGAAAPGRYAYTGWGWLPGTPRANWPQGGIELKEAITDEIDRVWFILSSIKGYHPYLMVPPKAWIDHYISRCNKPVWLAVANGDKQSLLHITSQVALSKKRADAGSKGGLAARRNYSRYNQNVVLREETYKTEVLAGGVKRSSYRLALIAKKKGDTADCKTIQAWFQARRNRPD